jgi:uncharacterized membrane protein YtjA (UPF0391 family)
LQRFASLQAFAAVDKRSDASRSHRCRYKTTRLARASSPRATVSGFREKTMLKWAIIFAIVSLITGWMGFRGVSGATATIAKVLFVCFVILFLLALLAVIGVLHLF